MQLRRTLLILISFIASLSLAIFMTQRSSLPAEVPTLTFEEIESIEDKFVVQPRDGDTVQTGETVSIILTNPMPPDQYEEVRVAGVWFHVPVIREPPFVVPFQVPEDYVGPLSFLVVVKTELGNNATEVVRLRVVPPPAAQLLSVEINPVAPDEVILHQMGQRGRIRFTGIFSDGKRRDLSNAQGTAFRIVDTRVAKVIKEDGGIFVQAVSSGSTILKASNGKKADEIQIVVRIDEEP